MARTRRVGTLKITFERYLLIQHGCLSPAIHRRIYANTAACVHYSIHYNIILLLWLSIINIGYLQCSFRPFPKRTRPFRLVRFYARVRYIRTLYVQVLNTRVLRKRDIIIAALSPDVDWSTGQIPKYCYRTNIVFIATRISQCKLCKTLTFRLCVEKTTLCALNPHYCDYEGIDKPLPPCCCWTRLPICQRARAYFAFPCMISLSASPSPSPAVFQSCVHKNG